MFGQVERDGLVENLSVQNHLVVGKVNSGRTPTTSVLISPVLDINGSDAEYTVVFDSSASVLGDILVVLISVVGEGFSAFLNFPSNLYVTTCGEFTEQLDITRFSEFALYLQFDGEVFLQCDENC